MDLQGEVTINAPAQAAWMLLGERFGHIGEWAVPITASSLEGEPRVGAIRTCHIAGFGPVKPGVIKERLIAFEPEAMSFTYDAIDGMPRFIGRAINRWSVHPLGEKRCVVRTHAMLDLHGPAALLGFLLKSKMQAEMSCVLDQLRYRLEQGRPHPRKKDRGDNGGTQTRSGVQRSALPVTQFSVWRDRSLVWYGVWVRRDLRTLSAFGQQLRHWRFRSGISQLDLATQAGTTPRHVSFIETGRSRPGRELVLRLAAALDVPIRERNAMLAAAGLPSAYPARDLTEQAMRPVRLVLDRVLRGHEPYPAWVVGRGLQFISSNRAAEALFPGMCGLPPESIVDLWFGPGPFRQLVENWQDVVWAGVASLGREAARTSDPRLFDLLRRAEAHTRLVPRPENHDLPELPVICPRLKIGDHTVRTISTVMRFDTAVEVTASELRVELMFPADEESDAYFKQGRSLQ